LLNIVFIDIILPEHLQRGASDGLSNCCSSGNVFSYAMAYTVGAWYSWFGCNIVDPSIQIPAVCPSTWLAIDCYRRSSLYAILCKILL